MSTVSFKTMLKKSKLWSFLRWYFHTFSFYQIPIGLIRYFTKINNLVHVPIPGGKIKVLLRPATTDMAVFNQIFIDQELNIEIHDVNLIIDAGAHIGLSSIWFAQKFPNARIIAIEPEPNNYKILQENIKNYKNIISIEGGLWYRNIPLKIQEGCTDTWSFKVNESFDKQGIKSYTMTDIINDNDNEIINILKIDIEGAELEVLNHSSNWINSVDLIIIEQHERFRPGCLSAISNAVKNLNFVLSYSGERIILRNQSRIQDAT